MKYRLLDKDELESLQEEFIKFLLVQNITMVDWDNLKQDNPKKAASLLEVFSDMVLDKILSETKFIEKVEAHKIETFQFNQQNIQLFVLESTTINFCETSVNNIDWSDCNLTSGTKRIEEIESREQLLFKHLENSYSLSDGELFKTLALAYAASKAN